MGHLYMGQSISLFYMLYPQRFVVVSSVPVLRKLQGNNVKPANSCKVVPEPDMAVVFGQRYKP